MNNKENQTLKDYTDQELIDEIAKRINSFSLDANCLIYPLVMAGSQYLNWYNTEKKSLKKSKKSNNHD